MTLKKLKAEATLQAQFISRVNYLEPGLADYVFAIPNGGKRDPRVAAALKAQGVRPGVPDVFVAMPVHPWAGLWIEFKTAKGRLSNRQVLYLSLLDRAGYRVAVSNDLDEAWAIFKEYSNGFDRKRSVETGSGEVSTA